MIIVDTALREREARNRPIRVGMIGAGFMGQGLTNQIENSVPGMRMAAVQNRHLREGAARLPVFRPPRHRHRRIPERVSMTRSPAAFRS